MKQIEPSSLAYGEPLGFDLCTRAGDVVVPAGQILEPIDLLLARDRLAEGVYVRDEVAWESIAGTEEAGEAGDDTEPGGGSAPRASTTGKEPGAPGAEMASGGEAGGGEAGLAASPARTDAGDIDGVFDLQQVPVRQLEPGMKLPRSIHDQDGVMLLEAGQEVTARFIDRLVDRGVQTLYTRLPEEDEAKPTGSWSDPALPSGAVKRASIDKAVERGELPTFPSPGSAANGEGGILTLGGLREKSKEGAAALAETAAAYAKMAREVLEGKSICLREARHLVRKLRGFATGDPSLPGLLLHAPVGGKEHEYLFTHGARVSLLAMATGHRTGFRSDDVDVLGLAGLFQDIGMLKIPGAIRFAPRKLTQQERSVIERHPIFTVDILQRYGITDKTVLMVCYQGHERGDRSGYPQRRHGMYIHPLARVLAVADTYAATTGARPYRKPLMPFRAMALLLDQVKHSRLDAQVVKQFLDLMSLFPIGSYVKLSTGVNAKVIRSTPGHHTQPVVCPLGEDGGESDDELDLSVMTEIKVAEALDAASVLSPAGGRKRAA